MPVCVATPPSMLCKPQSFPIKVQWTACSINNGNKHKQRHWQEVLPKRCLCALHHRTMLEWSQRVESPQQHTAIGKPIYRAEATGTNSFTLFNMEGKTEEKCSLFQRRLGGRGGVTSILRPSTSVPCSFSLALSASALDSNVTKPKPCEQEK